LLDTLSDKDGPPYIEDAMLILAARVEKVLALHKHVPQLTNSGFCEQCKETDNEFNWPCPTVRILNGESE
jgi:hypothetical protein